MSRSLRSTIAGAVVLAGVALIGADANATPAQNMTAAATAPARPDITEARFGCGPYRCFRTWRYHYWHPHHYWHPRYFRWHRRYW